MRELNAADESVSAGDAGTKFRDEIGDLAAALSGVAADLKDKQDKLLAYARGLESVISRQTAELAHERANLPVAVAERTAELKAANDDLGQQVAELSRRNHVITLFSRMNDFLQTSDTENEAYSIIAETATQLFPKDSGAVYVLSASRDMLDAAVAWGPLPPANLVFSPGECWAHRRGQVHLGIGHQRWCPHVTDSEHMYACLPLLAQGETLGILHVTDGPLNNDTADEAHMTEKSKLAKVFADNIGLGIANLKLRESMRNLSIRDPATRAGSRLETLPIRSSDIAAATDRPVCGSAQTRVPKTASIRDCFSSPPTVQGRNLLLPV